MVGKIDNVQKAISSGWKNINDQIWLIGSYNSEISLAALFGVFSRRNYSRPQK